MLPYKTVVHVSLIIAMPKPEKERTEVCDVPERLYAVCRKRCVRVVKVFLLTGVDRSRRGRNGRRSGWNPNLYINGKAWR